jgi:hypothetical protein
VEITSGSIWEPPLMVYVAVQLIKGRTPGRVYTSGSGIFALAPGTVSAPTALAAIRPPGSEQIAPAHARERLPGKGTYLCLLIEV